MVEGSDFRVQGSGFQVSSYGSRLQGLGLRGQDSKFRVEGSNRERRDDDFGSGRVARHLSVRFWVDLSTNPHDKPKSTDLTLSQKLISRQDWDFLS